MIYSEMLILPSVLYSWESFQSSGRVSHKEKVHQLIYVFFPSCLHISCTYLSAQNPSWYSVYLCSCLNVSQGKWKYPGRSHRNAIFKLEYFLTTAFQCKIWLTLILESCLGKDGRQRRNRRFSVGHRATQIWKVFQVRCHVKIEALRAVMHAWCHIRGR